MTTIPNYWDGKGQGYLPPPVTVPVAPVNNLIPPANGIKTETKKFVSPKEGWLKAEGEVLLGITPQALYDLVTMFISSLNETAGYGHINKDGVIDFVTQATTGTGSHVVTSAEEGAAASDRCLAATGEAPNIQIHTHPRMGVFWSGTDETAQAQTVKDGVKWGAGECHFLVVDGLNALVRKVWWDDKGAISYQDGTVTLNGHKMKETPRSWTYADTGTVYGSWYGTGTTIKRAEGEYKIGDEVSFKHENKTLYGEVLGWVTKEEGEKYDPVRTGWLQVNTYGKKRDEDVVYHVPTRLASLKLEWSVEEQAAFANKKNTPLTQQPFEFGDDYDVMAPPAKWWNIGDTVEIDSPTWGKGEAEVLGFSGSTTIVKLAKNGQEVHLVDSSIIASWIKVSPTGEISPPEDDPDDLDALLEMAVGRSGVKVKDLNIGDIVEFWGEYTDKDGVLTHELITAALEDVTETGIFAIDPDGIGWDVPFNEIVNVRRS